MSSLVTPTEQPERVPPRRIPSTVGGTIYLLVVAATAGGLAIVAFGPWRRGITVIGIALLVAALGRAALPDHDAGMLRVRRSRWVDVLMLVGVGSAMIALAAVIPDQPGA